MTSLGDTLWPGAIDTASSLFSASSPWLCCPLCCRGKKLTRRYVSSFGLLIRHQAGPACYIVAWGIDHAEKLQRVKRNLRCWGRLKIDGTPWEVRPRSRIPVKLSPKSIVFFDIRIEYADLRRRNIDYRDWSGGQACFSITYDRSRSNQSLFCESWSDFSIL